MKLELPLNESFSIKVFSRDDFEEINQNPPENSICISIRGRYDRYAPLKLSDQWNASLPLVFDANKTETDPDGFTPELADSVVEFLVNNITPEIVNLYIHCSQGEYRSPGIAKAVSIMTNAPSFHSPTFDKNVCWTLRRAFILKCS